MTTAYVETALLLRNFT